jgi:large repetitive protein
VEVAERNDLSLLGKARVLAAMNIAVADAVISCWNAKYTYEFWRPVTAIQLTDATWFPLITTPNHPEYPSGHSSQSGAASAVLGAFFGDATEFNLTSETAPGVTRHYSSFNDAAEEAGDARVFGGIHFRKACVDAKAMGEQIANYVLTHSFQRVHGK